MDLGAEDGGELYFLLFCLGSRNCPTKSEKLLEGKQIRNREEWGSREERGLDPQTPLGLLAPHLHRPVDVEVMQEGVLHLGQNLAEELEYLLSHPWGVLSVKEQSARQKMEPAHCLGCSPPLGHSTILPWSPLREHIFCKAPSLTTGTSLRQAGLRPDHHNKANTAISEYRKKASQINFLASQ